MYGLKKTLCFILCCTVLLGTMLTIASAANFTDQDKIVHTKAVEALVKLNVMEGKTDGSTFDPTSTISRAEMCKIICRCLNGGKDPTMDPLPTPTYSDTKGHWAEAYIAHCSSLGVVSGMGDGTFAPDSPVTAVQTAKMLLVAIGYSPDYEGFTGKRWRFHVNSIACMKDLYNNLPIDPSLPLSRDNAAQMIHNALNATLVKYEYALTTVNGKLNARPEAMNDEDGRTLLSKNFGATP